MANLIVTNLFCKNKEDFNELLMMLIQTKVLSQDITMEAIDMETYSISFCSNWDVPFERIKTLSELVDFDFYIEHAGQTIVDGTVGLWNLWLNTLHNTDYPPILLLRGICLTIFIGTLMAIGVYSLFSIATTRYNFITTKMNEKDYLIKEYIVDCPIAVKEMLLSYIEADELYGKVNAERKRFEWLKNDGECYHYWNFDKPKDKNDIEYQMKYLADQLEADKVYKLSDIITDKVKKKVSE